MSATGQCRFPRSSRVLGPLEFKHVFQKASKSGDQYWTVLARANTLSKARLGLAISRKHAARAVDRNRLKRLVRESFRHSQSLLGQQDMIVMARSGTHHRSTKELRKALELHWRALSSAQAKH